MRIVMALAACVLAVLPGVGGATTCTVYCPGGAVHNVDCDTNVDPCPSSSGSGNAGSSGYDYGAAQRAREAAEARAQAQAEADRLERERLAEEKRKKEEEQAEFIRNRDSAVLKGSVGSSIYENNGQLKGGTMVSAGLKELPRGGSTTSISPAQQTAWSQLHCAAALSGYAFAALRQATPDFQESSFLLEQASSAMNGQSLRVECPASPAFPDQHGRAVDMNQVKAAERKVISDAAVIVERMKLRQAPIAAAAAPAKPAPAASAAPPGGETPDEKARRVQRELNQVNSVKTTGKTQADIDAQERDRKRLAELILVNERIRKGELTSVTANIEAE